MGKADLCVAYLHQKSSSLGIITKEQAPLQGVCVLSPGVPAEALDRHCQSASLFGRRGGQGGDVCNGSMW